jgi:ribosomal protein S15P/S13E
MSDAQQTVYQLQQGLARVRAKKIVDPSGELRQRLSATVQDAVSWNQEDKQALLQVANALFEHWQINPKKNKKVRALLRVLKS